MPFGVRGPRLCDLPDQNSASFAASNGSSHRGTFLYSRGRLLVVAGPGVFRTRFPIAENLDAKRP